MKYRLLAIIALAVVVATSTFYGIKKKGSFLPSTEKQFGQTSVMITSVEARSGGSGVILSSGPKGSQILTNKHVCQLVQTGGYVVTGSRSQPKRYLVKSYRVYTRHDICLITVSANLNVTTQIAKKTPESFDHVTVAGHPALLPTIISRGYFADKMDIAVMVGAKECDGSENGQEALMCMFVGMKPVLETFESTPISALIMPGSSGSGIFNEAGEVAGLVFAGSGDGIGYGFAVPLTYLQDFMNNLSLYPERIPNAKTKPKSLFASVTEFAKICRKKQFSGFCRSTKVPGFYHE
jgi:S1-C subfamily serine protease